MTPSPLLRVTLDRHEAAKALGIGVSTLDDMTRAGLIPSIHDPRWPGIRLYSLRALEEWAYQESRHEEAGRGKASMGHGQHLQEDWGRPVGRRRSRTPTPLRADRTRGTADAG